MIIGVTGTYASGKDTISDYLQKKGFFHFSLSDAIRGELDEIGLPRDRDTLIRVGNEYRQKFGNDIWAKRAIEAVKARAGSKNCVLTSIRNSGEVAFLKKQKGFILINVDAPIETRYERAKARKRGDSDFVDLETFKKQEDKEKTGTGSEQNLTEVGAMANYTIENSDTLDELYKKIERIINESKD